MSEPVLPLMGEWGPFNSVTPFTKVDNYTYLEILHQLKNKINEFITYAGTQDKKIIEFRDRVSKQIDEFTNKFVHHTVSDVNGVIHFAMMNGPELLMYDKAYIDTLSASIDNNITQTDNKLREKLTNDLKELNDTLRAFIADERNKLKLQLDKDINRIETLAESKANRYYHVVTDYGAKGDGATDDTEAIKRTITAAGKGGHIYFPKGIFKVTTELEFLPDQRVDGSSASWGDNSPNSAIFFDIRDGNGVSCKYGNTFTNLRFDGPGPSRTNCIGLNCANYVTVRDCSFYGWYTANKFKQNWYTEVERVKYQGNRLAIDAEYCYNLTIKSPHIIADEGSKSYKYGINATDATMMTIHGGSIESYEVGIKMGLGVSVACFGVYFETDKEGQADNRRGIIFSSPKSNLLMMGCQVYLTNHKSFIDASNQTCGETITLIGNKYKAGANGTVSAGYVIDCHENNTGFLKINSIGDNNSQSDHNIYKYRRENVPAGSLISDPSHFFPYRGGWEGLRAGKFVVAPAEGAIVTGAGTNLPSFGEGMNHPVGVLFWHTGKNKLVVFNGTDWVDVNGGSI